MQSSHNRTYFIILSQVHPSSQANKWRRRECTHTQIEGAIIVNNCAEFYWIFGMFRSRHAEKFTSRKSATALVADKSGISSAKVGSVFHKPKDKPHGPYRAYDCVWKQATTKRCQKNTCVENMPRKPVSDLKRRIHERIDSGQYHQYMQGIIWAAPD